MRSLFFVAFLVLFCGAVALPAQSFSKTIEGTIKSKNGESLIGATILVTDTLGNIINYSVSQVLGYYSVEVEIATELPLKIEVRSLGYTTVEEVFIIRKEIKGIRKDFELEVSAQNMEEITIQGLKSIKDTGDTILFQAADFRDNTEEVAEDLLKKLPGVSVGASGKISYQGKEISKILLDGDDLTASNYKMLSKNLPAELIGEVEILKNHHDSRLLKGVVKSDEIAINLKVEDGKKAPLFGDVQLGGGLANVYDVRSDLISYTKGFKGLLFLNANNIGDDPVGSDFQRFSNARLAYNQVSTLERTFDKVIQYPMLMAKQMFRRNKARYASLAWVSKPNDKLRINGLQSIYHDDISFNQYESTRFLSISNGADLIQDEDLREKMSPKEYFSDVRIEKQLSSNSDIKLSYNLVRNQDLYRAQFKLNGIGGVEKGNLDQYQHLVELSNTTKLKNKLILENQLSFVNGGIVEDFDLANEDNIYQTSEQLGNTLAWVNNLKWALENTFVNIQSGLVFSKMSFYNNANAISKDQTTFLDSLSNSLSYKRTSLFSEILIEKSLNKHLLVIVGGRMRLEKTEVELTGSQVFFEPSLKVKYEKGLSSVSLLYHKEYSLLELLDFTTNPILQSFSTLSFNTFSVSDYYKNDTWILAYKYRDNYQKYITTFLQLMYVRQSPSIYSILKIDEGGFAQVNYSINRNFVRPRWSMNTGVDKYIPKLSSTLKFTYGLSYNENLYGINNNEQFSSFLSNKFNLSFGTKFAEKIYLAGSMQLKLDRFRAKLDHAVITKNIEWNNRITYRISDKINLSLKSQHLFFSRVLNNTKSINHIGSMVASYQIRPNKLSLKIIVHNIFNQKQLSVQTNNQYAYIDQQYDLLPRYLLLKVNYRL